MKRFTFLFAFVVIGVMVLSACGGGGSATGGTTSGGAVKPGASGIKDAALIGKWLSADGGNGYDFKDDYSVIVTNVNAQTTTSYNITEGGKGSGKIEIGEDNGKSTLWDYKIDGDRVEFTTPDGRSRRMRKQ